MLKWKINYFPVLSGAYVFVDVHICMFSCKTSIPAIAHSLKNHDNDKNIFSVSELCREKLEEMPRQENMP